MREEENVILSEAKRSRRILAARQDRRWMFSFAAKPRSFDCALTRSAQDDRDRQTQYKKYDEERTGNVPPRKQFVRQNALSLYKDRKMRKDLQIFLQIL